MLNPNTEAKIDHGLAKLAMDQLTGEAPPPGGVTHADIAVRAGVSKATIIRIERIALAKVQRALLSSDIDPSILKRLQS